MPRRQRSFSPFSQPEICSGVQPSARRSRTKVCKTLSFSIAASRRLRSRVGSGGVTRRVAPAGQPVATKLPRYGGFRSAEAQGDSADRSAGRAQNADLFSFVIGQM